MGIVKWVRERWELNDFNQDSTHQAGQVTSKETNTGEHRELQADCGHWTAGLLEKPRHKQ